MAAGYPRGESDNWRSDAMISDSAGLEEWDDAEEDDLFTDEEEEDELLERAMIGESDDERRRLEEQRPLVEAGEGEAEGFELSERELIEHASHGDEQSAHAVLHDQGADEEDTGEQDGEADHIRSSESEED
jgi:hypothetical protein